MTPKHSDKIPFARVGLFLTVECTFYAITDQLAATFERTDHIEFVRETFRRPRFCLMMETPRSDTFAHIERCPIGPTKNVDIMRPRDGKLRANACNVRKVTLK